MKRKTSYAMKKNFAIGIVLGAVLLLGLFGQCRKDPYPVDPSTGYPQSVGEIFLGKCATSGCHDSKSKGACGGIDMSTWENLFKGGNSNAVVIPYSAEQSILFFAVNTFSDLGPQITPTMPLHHQALTREEVTLIRNWIAIGAPDRNGYVKFSGDPNRSKIYVTNQGCDLITLFDADTKLAMRCFHVGRTAATEAPHDLALSPDGQFMYVSFFAGSYFQKYNTTDDRLVAELDLGIPSWHSMSISPDSRYALVSQWDYNGRVALVDLQSMTIRKMYLGLYVYPHGSAFSQDGNFSYVVCQSGNFIYKTDLTDLVSVNWVELPLQTGDIPSTSGIYKPYVVKFAPDYSSYFVICQGTNEIRMFNAANDSLLHVIPATGVPQLIDFSTSTPYAFITTMVDTTNASTESSVDIINWHTGQFIRTVYPGWQDRGLVVDDAHGVVYVGNRNVDAGGPAPHHTTVCNGRDGDVTLIDLNTLEVVPGWRCEVSVDPYCLDIRR